MAFGGEFRNVIKSVKTAVTFRRIPDKWKDYAACGETIRGERLISFKTPLAEKYHYIEGGDNTEDSLQHQEEFTPSDLFREIRKNGDKLGLVVDFTNTKRYYEPEEITNRNVEYKKIKCEGKIVPPEKVVSRFKATILSFFKRFPTSNSLVGVHCTHGLNRAGYIVCRYLIDCKGYAPDEAIEVKAGTIRNETQQNVEFYQKYRNNYFLRKIFSQGFTCATEGKYFSIRTDQKAFNRARGYQMERKNYIEDLRTRKPSLISDMDIDDLIKVTTFSEDEPREERYNGRWNVDDNRGGGPFRRGTPWRGRNVDYKPYELPHLRYDGRPRAYDERYDNYHRQPARDYRYSRPEDDRYPPRTRSVHKRSHEDTIRTDWDYDDRGEQQERYQDSREHPGERKRRRDDNYYYHNGQPHNGQPHGQWQTDDHHRGDWYSHRADSYWQTGGDLYWE